jgi:gluconolactonase
MNFHGHFSPRGLIFFGVLSCLSFLSDKSAVAQIASGAFSLSPAHAPAMVLEAVGAGTSDGTVVSIGAPTSDAKQKWNFIAKGNNLYVIRPSYSTNLVLAPLTAGTNNGTAMVLQTETDKPTQMWTIRANDNGSFSFVPQYAPGKALDDFQGSQTAGAKQDIWDFDPNDPHVQWTLKPLDGATMPTLTAAAHIPEGTIKEFAFNTSAIFPGTQRNCVVYIPAQYDGSKPACVYVEQDGYNPEYRVMLDQLIASKDIPVTVGIFIWPGDVHAPAGSTGVRRNRSFEYDGVSDNYVRFLTEEALPYVAKTFNLNLSTSGNDRCIAGASSGGISAFNAAWQRPDQFARVYACSGSFTAFRGGNEFPTLVRKTEAKPIRVYLTTATEDMENCAGDWYLIDQEMDKALRFSGYDYSYQVVEGGHTAGWIEHFPDAMRFIWKDWPAAIPEGTSAPRVRDVITDTDKWEMAANGYQDARSPACNSKGEIFFVDAAANKIHRIGLDGKPSVFLDDAAHANGLSIGPKDELYTVSKTTGNVMSYDASGQGHAIASGLPGQYVLARPDGGLYVTTAETKPGDGSQVWFLKDGAKTQVDSGLKSATGLAYRPDQWLLSVADGRSKWVYSYQIANDGSLTSKERFFCLQVPDWEDDAGAESVCYAQEGQMLVGTRSGVQICADDGPTQVILPVPDRSRVVGVALGGPDMHTLFAFCGGKIWKRVVKIHAIGAFSPAVPVNGTPL